MKKQFDAVVIGGGPGGYVAAIRLAQLGKKCALIEKAELGGTCLNRGCIPTKALLQSAEVYRTVRDAAVYGISAGPAAFDYAKIAARKATVVDRLRKGVAALEKKNGVEVIAGAASFQDAHTLLVGGDEIEAKDIIIATGSAPARVPIPGIDTPGVVDSDAVLSWTQCPKSVVIIGGGVIGIEFATLFAALDVKVTVIEMLPEILPPIDAEISALMRKELARRGVDIAVGAKVDRIETGVTVHYTQGEARSVTAEACIVAVGRRPVTDGLNLEAAGVALSRGFVVVDEYLKTNVPGIWAIGDVTGKVQLAHVASAQALVAAESIAGATRRMDYGIVPSCVYTEPEIASIGLSEGQAKEKGLAYKVGRFATAANGRSMIMGETAGTVKLIVEEKTGELLGCHIMAPRATDIIGEIGAAMRAEGTLDELSDTIHAHPTVSEMIMEAAHAAQGHGIHQ